MSNSQNTGRRYIPKFFTYGGSTEWRPNIAYSAKTIVTKNFKVYTSIVNVPSNIGSPEDNPKYWQPAVITDEVMQTIIDELGKLDGDVSEFEHRVEVLENEVGELEIAIRDVQEDVDKLKNALTAVEIVDTASGAIASFADGSDGLPVKGLTVQMEPIQAGSGDPSPDNVRPISGCDSVTVTRAGKNLFDVNAISYISVGTVTRYGVRFDKPGTYAVSVQNANDYMYARTFNADGSTKNTYNIVNDNIITNATFTIADGESFAIYDAIDSGKATATERFNGWKCQVETGSSFTAYEPYTAQTVTIQLGQTVYGGTLDVTNGTLTVDRAMVDLGTLIWSGVNSNFFYATITGMKANVNTEKCSAYATVNAYSDYNFADKSVSISQFVGRVAVHDSAYSDATAFESAMNGVQLCYKLAQPVNVQLTAQQMTTLLGQNNVWSDADSVAVDYVADTKLYIAKVIADALS